MSIIIRNITALLVIVLSVGCAVPKERTESAGVDGGNGVNGICSICHGSAENDAPPLDTNGNSDTSERGVGAHQSHVNDGDLSVAIPCSECHIVPDAVDDPGHWDSDLPAEVVFGALATTNGADPSWDGNSCANSYCHGSTMQGGTNTEPVWTVVDGTEVVCGSCHSLPPPAPHPDQTDCENCHSAVVDADQNIIDPSIHINGVVNFLGDNDNNGSPLLPCNSCHGNASNYAPPFDTSGNSSTSERGVGAHQSHVNEGDLRVAVPCTECHIVPDAVDDPGHWDSALPAEVIFGRLAKTDGANPSWDGNSCASSYCHGNFLRGKNTSPIWTVVDGSQKECGLSCHGTPPTYDHPEETDCGDCHEPTVARNCDVAISPCPINNKTTHINGITEEDD